MIEINNSTPFLIDEEYFKKIAKKILKEEKEKGRISIGLVDSVTIKKINKKYRHKNQPTDILSFGKDKNFLVAPNELGEIIICPQQVKRNSEKYKVVFKKELARVLIHGILHLLGYDHGKDKKNAGKMREKEDYYISKIN